jgi:hypothetical protein
MTKVERTITILPDEVITSKIYYIQGQKVMIERDLALLCGVEVKQLKRQVNRNMDRFPDDFMFELTKEEYEILRCHFGALKRGEHTKYLPYVFTEQGVAMLSSVLNSKYAIVVNTHWRERTARDYYFEGSAFPFINPVPEIISKYKKIYFFVFAHKKIQI